MGCCGSTPESPRISNTSDQYQQINSIWDYFVFKQNLGNGGSAQVCMVSELDTDKQYAMKMMKSALFHYLFMKEIRMMKQLDCPHIVMFEKAYRGPREDYIIMEYCSGDSLLERITKNQKYTEGIASVNTRMMLLALKYLHGKDIVHRDIKPENFVYSTKEGLTLKLIDFGIAMDAIPEKSYTWHAGTPYYMAPEVIENNKRSGMVCKKSDMWSLGVCLFIMLNGEAPFKGSSVDAVYDNILAQSKIRFLTQGISDEAMDFVLKLLERDHEKRITVEEALQHPWVMNGGKNENEIISSTVSSLRSFSAKKTVLSAIRRVAATNLSDYDETHYKEVFNQFDRNGDGHITKEECTAALELNMIYPKEAERWTEEIFKNADLNRDDKITYDEFKIALMNGSLSLDMYKIHAIFNALDTNRDGKICIEEFTNILPKGDSEELSELVEAFTEADENQDGTLCFQEFSRILNNSTSRRRTTIDMLEPQEMDKVIDLDEQYSRHSVRLISTEGKSVD